MLIKAFLIAIFAHRGQKDKGGKPYIFHPIAVARKVKGIKCKTVALLHDTIEDTNITLYSLKRFKFSNDINEAVNAITKCKGEAYYDYLQRVRQNDIARIVKLADIEHNSDLSRLKTVTEKDTLRLHKYNEATKYLKEVITKKES